jgi:hypothetical protein
VVLAKNHEKYIGKCENEVIKCGPAQLNIHFKGVSDHGDKHDLVFLGEFSRY